MTETTETTRREQSDARLTCRLLKQLGKTCRVARAALDGERSMVDLNRRAELLAEALTEVVETDR